MTRWGTPPARPKGRRGPLCAAAPSDGHFARTIFIFAATQQAEDDAASAIEEDDGEEDNERSERLFGYDPDGNGNVWDEYQAVMGDPMFAW